MALESWNYANEPTVVVGGRGEFGTRVMDGLRRGLHVANLTICEIGDPIQDLLARNRIAFFATDEDTTRDILQSARDKLTSGYVVLEGASTKGKLISLLENLDRDGISGASVHLGIKTDSSWAGAKVWLCRVGPNSDRALLLANHLFAYFDTRLVPINLRDHQKVQKTQVHTFVGQLTSAISLRNRGIALEDLDTSATANSQLGILSTARGVGQSPKIIAEVLGGQPEDVSEIIDSDIKALQELRSKLPDKEKLEKYVETLQRFHGRSTGKLQEMFGDTELLVAEILRIALYNLQFSASDDTPGTLLKLLTPFAERRVNLMAIASARIPPTKEAIQQGEDAKRDTVLFRTGVDLNTIDTKKEQEIKARLREMGCIVTD
ncbi:hypothetical protein HYZ06_01915 [Candidatus Daviesbacteria bacterium]|nr:hypothetical protein [Candidatus Daviesbacteria bacterium]